MRPSSSATSVGRGSSPRVRAALLVALLALVVLLAWPSAEDGWTQSAHYALVRALADGTPQVDPYLSETGDLSWWEGHYYSTKAPGLAVASLPLYVPLERAGLWPDSRSAQLWLLTTWTVLTSALLLVLLVRRVAEDLAPGTGMLAALTLAAATLVLPFGTLFFAHVPAALLVFWAFARLLARRGAAVAGLVAGLAVCVEYQTALAGAILVLYAAHAGGLGRAARYAGGLVAGVLPLLAYNAWAFGSPTHVSTVNAIVERGASGHDVVGAHQEGLFGITRPSVTVLRDLLLEQRGLLVTTPVVAGAVLGLVLLYRSRRAEALTLGGIGAAYLLFNAGVVTPFGGPFGGNTPGPRYLITALPFVLAPVGLAYRRAPGVLLGLWAVSFVAMLAATVTEPLIQSHETSLWWSRLDDTRFHHGVVETIADGSWRGVLGIVPTLAAAGAIAFLLVREVRRVTQPAVGDAICAALTVVVWLGVVLAARVLARTEETVSVAGAAVLVALAAAVLVVAARRATRSRLAARSP